MTQNVLIDTDSYKSSHYLQFPPRTARMFSYLESRGGMYPSTVFFGLQYLLKEYFSKPITLSDVAEANEFFTAHGLPFDLDGWKRVLTHHDGFLPLLIKAVPEGTIVPNSMPLLSVESTDEELFHLVSWVETQLVRLWYPTTVCTLSRSVKQIIKAFLQETADDLSGLPFKLHDFGSRGVSSRESAAIGGAAHLVNFMGSDTVVGVLLANKYYNEPMAGFSIPASEHSTITSWTKSHEVDAYDNMLNQFAKPGKIVACVSDSYDVFNAAEQLWGSQLRRKVIDSGATLVIRPDSGEPVWVVNQLLHILAAKFGTTTNSKGYRLLKHVRIIQGDGMNEETLRAVLKSAKLAGFSADNIAFGMGGGLLQDVNRDTQRFAYKCSEISIREEGRMEDGNAYMQGYKDVPVYKDPVTDPGKRSKAGRIGTSKIGGKFEVCDTDSRQNMLQPVFKDGRILRETTLKEIRARADEG